MIMRETPVVNECALFAGKHFHAFIHNKTESSSGLHQHDYYEFTLVLTGRYYQEINGKCVLLTRGDFVFIPPGSQHQSFYEFGVTKIFNVGISHSFFTSHYKRLLSENIIASQVYSLKNEYLRYVESEVASLNFHNTEFDEFLETLTFCIINRVRHFRMPVAQDSTPLWLKETIAAMYDKANFSEHALNMMVTLSGKTQSYLTRAMQQYYAKTPM
ncbi:MAG: HTH-type transcriptional regulator ChbR [Candidatus Erwinia impunctatus]|nr:HTH-type transcriptional regulator ChbR [Culicoides impunctatus]